MKKLLFLLLAAPLMGLQVMADSVKPESLEGIWQQVQVSKTDGHTMLLPVWKVLRSDGTFSTFLIVNRSAALFICKSVITFRFSWSFEFHANPFLVSLMCMSRHFVRHLQDI